eukprot:224501-Chlamydomonas_euryale.AAC.2
MHGPGVRPASWDARAGCMVQVCGLRPGMHVRDAWGKGAWHWAVSNQFEQNKVRILPSLHCNGERYCSCCFSYSCFKCCHRDFHITDAVPVPDTVPNTVPGTVAVNITVPGTVPGTDAVKVTVPAPCTATASATFISTAPVTGRVTPAPVNGRVTPAPVNGRVTPAPVTGRVTPSSFPLTTDMCSIP